MKFFGIITFFQKIYKKLRCMRKIISYQRIKSIQNFDRAQRIDESIQNFINRHQTAINDDRIKYFKNKCKAWYGDTINQDFLLLEDMLSKFIYYDKIKLYEHFIYVYNLIKPNNERTLYLALNDEDKESWDSSKNHLFNMSLLIPVKYYTLHSLHNYITKNNIEFDNIIIFDDIAGSGSTFSCFIENNHKILTGKKIFYIIGYITQIAKKNLSKYNELLDIYVYAHYEERNKCTNKELLEKISYKRGIKQYLGFNNSEALVAFYSNTPNNTYGIFWFESAKESEFVPSIFPRNTKHAKKFDFHY